MRKMCDASARVKPNSSGRDIDGAFAVSGRDTLSDRYLFEALR